MEYIKKNYKSLLLIFILILGLVVGLVLIKNPKIFKSRANLESVGKITGDNMQKLNPDEAKNLELPGNEEGNITTFKVQGNQFSVRYSP